MDQKPLLEVEDLAVYFPVHRGAMSRVVAHVKAVDGISFRIHRGETLSLVGESGSGKTTAGRAILRLVEPTRGRVTFDGADVSALSTREMRGYRQRMQLIFQDPYGSLNPRMTVGGVLREAMSAHDTVPKEQQRERAEELMEMVGLPADALGRYPHEFSGGQRQRVGIARALATGPDLIVADEPVSALDVSVQAQILNLLEDLQDKLGVTYLFVGHNLSVIRHISDRVAVMYLGHIVEIGSVDAIFNSPTHPYTKALLSAVPTPDPTAKIDRILLEGDVPSPINPPSGCPFHPRCPHAQPDCATRSQHLVEVGAGHEAACHVFASAEVTTGS